jgi:hypothetical protein
VEWAIRKAALEAGMKGAALYPLGGNMESGTRRAALRNG